MLNTITSKENILNVLRDIYQDTIRRNNYGENMDFMRRLNDSKSSLNRLKDVRSYEGYFMNRLEKVVENHNQSMKSIPEESYFLKKHLREEYESLL